MGKVYDAIDGKLERWIGSVPLFFVATAPSGDAGHVNCSPKGPIETLRVLGPRTVAYLDTVGSGAETIAHLRENGRIVIMLCAFAGPPRIVRLHGRGRVVARGCAEYEELAGRFDPFDTPAGLAARRSVIVVEVARIADSCGYGVPEMGLPERRPQMRAWVERKLAQGGPAALDAYMAEKNAVSIDDLPALDT